MATKEQVLSGIMKARQQGKHDIANELQRRYDAMVADPTSEATATQPTASARPDEPGTAMGILDQIGAGINRGVVGTLALPDTLGDLTVTGLSKAGWIDPEKAAEINKRTPGYEEMLADWEGFAGKLPEPRNRVERTVSDVAEFIPGLGVGGAGRATIKKLAQELGQNATRQIAIANAKRAAVNTAAGLGSSVAGQATEGTPVEGAARLVGALAGGTAGAGATGKAGFRQVSRGVGNPNKTRKVVGAKADAMYDTLRAQDATYDKKDFNKFIKTVPDKVKNVLEPSSPLTGSKVRDMAKKAPTASKLEDVRSDLGDIAFSGGPPTVDMKRAARLRGVLDDYLNTAPLKTKSGMAAPDYRTLRGNAREMAQRGILDDLLERMGRKAEGYTSGADSGIRNSVGSYFRQNMDNLDPAMEEAFQTIIKREGMLGPLANVSSRLGGGIVGAATGASMFGWPGLILSGGGHAAGRMAADLIAKKQLKNARQIALAGRKARKGALKLSAEERKNKILQLLIGAARSQQY